MPRYLALHRPCFRLERLGWEDHQVVVLVGVDPSDPPTPQPPVRVLAATKAARQCGARVGMTLTELREVVPHARRESVDLGAEHADLVTLGNALHRLLPRLALLPPDGCWADVSSDSEREYWLIDAVDSACTDRGHRARAVIASDLLLALALVRHLPNSTVIPPGQEAQAIHWLPLEALALPPAQLEELRSRGLRTCAALAALPVTSLEPFGDEVVCAHEALRAGTLDGLAQFRALAQHQPSVQHSTPPRPRGILVPFPKPGDRP